MEMPVTMAEAALPALSVAEPVLESPAPSALRDSENWTATPGSAACGVAIPETESRAE